MLCTCEAAAQPLPGSGWAINREDLVKLNELTEIISKQAKVDETSVRKTLKAMTAYFKEQITKEERFTAPGLGSFVRKEGKEPGTSRILFKPFKDKEVEEAGVE